MSREHLKRNGSASGFNYQMCVLSAIGIIFVILGHINRDEYAIGTFYNWFPYYSFHLPIFLFVSGYFFKDPKASSPYQRHWCIKALGKYFLKLIRNLIIPYFLVNGLFLFLNNYLCGQLFTFVNNYTFSLRNWLVLPWIRCYVLTHSLPTWYMLGLFYAMVFFVFIRLLFGAIFKKEFLKDLLLLLFTLAIGIAAVEYCRVSIPQGNSEWIRNFCRAGAMLFFIQLGIFYRKHLEKLDRLPGTWYFIILFAVQAAVIILSGNAALSPNLYNMTDFGVWGYDYFICGTTGLLIWLRVARIIASRPAQSKFLIFIGNNTKYIMEFHIFGFFLLNCLFRQLRLWGLKFSMIEDFNNVTFHKYFYYYVPDTRALILYFLAGLFLSLLFAKVIGLIKLGVRIVLKKLKPAKE